MEMTADPQRPISSIEILDAEENDRLDRWSHRAASARPVTAPASIPAVFAEHADRTSRQ